MKEDIRIRMLDAYGADISRWPQGRIAGRLGLLTSARFRAARREARRLDRAIREGALPLRDPERLERRLLAAMGIGPLGASREPAGVSPAWATALAVACVALGLALGGVYGGEAATEIVAFGGGDDLWEEVAQDDAFGDLS